MSDVERWKRVQALFHGALDRPEGERRDYVIEGSPGAPDVAEEVLALLGEHVTAGSLLDLGVAHVADDVLDGIVAVPATVGPYRIGPLLGVGGMGVVYLAERDDLESRVAIKFLRDARLSPERRERFRREQRMLAGLSHPAIAQLYDASTLPDGTPYFVMEYVDGEPLNDYCRRHGLGLEERLRLFARACEAVQHAHRQALIHRDLKPSNLLAGDGPEGEPPVVKLLDFGIAKPAEVDTDAAQATGAVLMTPAYASPEQLEGGAVGVGTDVYSLGVILYELLTGELLFELAERTPYEAARTVIEDPRVSPSVRVRQEGAAPRFAAALGRRRWADLDALCLTALHRDPDRRYGSVEALARDAQRFLDGRPLEARTDGALYTFGKFVRRRRRLVAAVGIVAVALSSLIAFYTWRLAEARDAAVAEAARTQRIQQFMLELFEGGDVDAGPAAGMTVVDLIERGVREADALDRDPQTQAGLYQTLGEVSLRLAELDRADELLHRSLELRRSRPDGDPIDVALNLLTISELRSQQGRPDDAEQIGREALGIIERTLPADDPRRTGALGSIGTALRLRGDYPAALELLEEAVRLDDARGDVEALQISLGELANTNYYAGNYKRSEALNRRLLELVRAERGEQHPTYATCLINIAASRRWLGSLEQAEELYREALVINEAYHGRDHAVTASNLGLIGSILVSQEKYQEARVFLDEALVVRERVYGPDHFQVATTLNELANADVRAGLLDEAEAAYSRALAIYRKQVGEEHPFTATATSNLATVAYRRGDMEAAEHFLREALAIYETALKPDHSDVAIAHIKLGQLLGGIERDEEATAELERGLEILEGQANPQTPWIELARRELAEIADRSGA